MASENSTFMSRQCAVLLHLPHAKQEEYRCFLSVVFDTTDETGLDLHCGDGTRAYSKWCHILVLQSISLKLPIQMSWIVNSSCKIRCLALAEKIWPFFHTHLCCSANECMFITNVAPLKKKSDFPTVWDLLPRSIVATRDNLPNTYLQTFCAVNKKTPKSFSS